jgi:hypothetical protein
LIETPSQQEIQMKALTTILVACALAIAFGCASATAPDQETIVTHRYETNTTVTHITNVGNVSWNAITFVFTTNMTQIQSNMGPAVLLELDTNAILLPPSQYNNIVQDVYPDPFIQAEYYTYCTVRAQWVNDYYLSHYNGRWLIMTTGSEIPSAATNMLEGKVSNFIFVSVRTL